MYRWWDSQKQQGACSRMTSQMSSTLFSCFCQKNRATNVGSDSVLLHLLQTAWWKCKKNDGPLSLTPLCHCFHCRAWAQIHSNLLLFFIGARLGVWKSSSNDSSLLLFRGLKSNELVHKKGCWFFLAILCALDKSGCAMRMNRERCWLSYLEKSVFRVNLMKSGSQAWKVLTWLDRVVIKKGT